MVDVQISDNAEKKRYEALVEGKRAFIDYIRTKNIVYLTHTEVPAGLEGRGVGSALVAEVLRQLRDDGVKLAPLCPFVAAYIKNNPEWKDLVDNRYNLG